MVILIALIILGLSFWIRKMSLKEWLLSMGIMGGLLLALT